MAARQNRTARPVAFEAVVNNPGPDGLTVLVDDFDSHRVARDEWEVAGWQSRADAVPAAGDECLVVVSDAGRRWVVVGNWTGTPPEARP